MTMGLRLLATLALTVPLAPMALARDTWRYVDAGNVKLFGTHEPDLTVLLSCEAERVRVGVDIKGSTDDPVIDSDVAPGDGRYPVSLTFTVDEARHQTHDAYAITISEDLAMVFIDGKASAYQLREHIESAQSNVSVAVNFDGHALAPRSVDAKGSTAGARTWMSACDELFRGF